MLYPIVHWWSNYEYHFNNKLKVTYNDIMRILLCLSRYHTVNQIFVNVIIMEAVSLDISYVLNKS